MSVSLFSTALAAGAIAVFLGSTAPAQAAAVGNDVWFADDAALTLAQHHRRPHGGHHGRPGGHHSRPGHHGRPGHHVRPDHHRPHVRPGRWARPGGYWWRPGGAIAAGAALGFVSAATAASWAGAAPGPGMCWYYTNRSRREGFWDVCP